MVDDSGPEIQRITKNSFHIDFQEYDLHYVWLTDALSHILSWEK